MFDYIIVLSAISIPVLVCLLVLGSVSIVRKIRTGRLESASEAIDEDDVIGDEWKEETDEEQLVMSYKTAADPVMFKDAFDKLAGARIEFGTTAGGSSDMPTRDPAILIQDRDVLIANRDKEELAARRVRQVIQDAKDKQKAEEAKQRVLYKDKNLYVVGVDKIVPPSIILPGRIPFPSEAVMAVHKAEKTATNAGVTLKHEDESPRVWGSIIGPSGGQEEVTSQTIKDALKYRDEHPEEIEKYDLMRRQAAKLKEMEEKYALEQGWLSTAIQIIENRITDEEALGRLFEAVTKKQDELFFNKAQEESLTPVPMEVPPIEILQEEQLSNMLDAVVKDLENALENEKDEKPKRKAPAKKTSKVKSKAKKRK